MRYHSVSDNLRKFQARFIEYFKGKYESKDPFKECSKAFNKQLNDKLKDAENEILKSLSGTEDFESNESSTARYFNAKESKSIRNKLVSIHDAACNEYNKELRFKLAALTKEYISEHLGRNNAKQRQAHDDILLLVYAIDALN